MNTFTFDDPAWLGLLLLLPLAGWLQGASGAPPAVVYSSLKLVQRFSRIAPNRAGRFLATLRWLALTACILGMARPQWGEGRERIRASGIDIMLTLDLSDSMEAKDFRNEGRNVTRLDISKQVLKEFVEGRPSDRIGLIVFSGLAFIASPPTLNHDYLIDNIDRFDNETASPQNDDEGTAIGSGITAAVNRLRGIKDSKSKIIILMTDGENNTGKVEPEEAAEAAAVMGVKIYTIGIGKEGTELVLRDQFGLPRHHQLVGINKDRLRDIAERTGGKFFYAESTEALRAVYNEIDQLEKTEREEQRFLRYHDLFGWFVGTGLMLLLLELVLAQTLLRKLP
ncbi:VWA domain-containing protein [Verrucomicrobia bacterium]|nr:VWA domain-containing protein [Verrucomicrobiota bacterium]